MILKMSRIRVIGPRADLPPVMQAIQDTGLLHLATPPDVEPLQPVGQPAGEARFCRHLKDIIQDVDAAFLALRAPAPTTDAGGSAPVFATGARRARKTRLEAETLRARHDALEEERALIIKYQGFFSAFEELLRRPARWAGGHAFHVLLRPGQDASLTRLRQELETRLGGEFELWSRPLPSGETALLLMVPPVKVAQIERLLNEGQIQEIPTPTGYAGDSLAEIVPKMLTRLAALPGEVAAVEAARRRLLAESGPELARLRQAAQDALGRVAALGLSGVTPHTFVLEGWLPRRARQRFISALAQRAGKNVIVEEVATEKWVGDGTPVVLSNPRLFRPFELIVRTMPLPRYGSIDPTPYIAVFFPMFFGVALGDVGYGMVLGAAALLLRFRSRPGGVARSLAEIAGACALFAVIFGFLYGEFLGDLGHRWFGLHPLLFDRKEAVVPFLIFAVSLGVVHIVLGLVLGIATAHTRRERLGKGISAAMVVLTVLALLAAFRVLPAHLFNPAVIALLVAFPVLVIAEGLIAPVELLSTMGNILSYARIMALGTASVMLAVVANQMTGATGSLAVGILFALLFHLVNFALGLFSPTIHALRLHYVEFFGKFYSPGGIEYRPLAHSSPGLQATPGQAPIAERHDAVPAARH